jgi:chromosome segregation ATPase
MEQRVRDIIESLQKFDLDLRVSEGVVVSFKYDGYATRLRIQCDNIDYDAKIAELNEANAKLEGQIEDLSERIEEYKVEVSDLEDDKVSLQSRIDGLESEVRSYCRSLEVIRDAIP